MVPTTEYQLDIGVAILGFDLIVTGKHLNENTLSRLV